MKVGYSVHSGLITLRKYYNVLLDFRLNVYVLWVGLRIRTEVTDIARTGSVHCVMMVPLTFVMLYA